MIALALMLFWSFLEPPPSRLSAKVLARKQQSNQARESIFDRVVHIEKTLVLDVPQAPRLDADVNIVKQRVNVGDADLYVEQEGDGLPLVLIHGGPGATHHYFHPYFSRLRGAARIIYYDQRGCGLSDYKPGKGYSIEQAVDDLENLRKALRVKKWIVLGHSYGGLLAQFYAVKYPGNVAGLVLVDSQLPTFMSLPSRRNDFMSQEEIKRINEIHSTDGLSVSQRVYNSFLNGDWKRQQFYRPSRERMAQIALYEWVQDVNFNGIMHRDQLNIDLRGAFENCPIPTLILDGKWDLFWSPDKPKIMRRFHPASKLIVFEHSNHFPFQDEPGRFFRVLRAFLHDLPKTSSSALISWKNHLANWKKEQDEFKRKEAEFVKLIRGQGIERAAEIYREAKRKVQHAHSFREYILDDLGYEFLRNKRVGEAIKVFELNAEAYPQSYNVYDSLGEAHMTNGNKEFAVRNYRKSLELRPDNRNAAAMLKKLGE